MQTPTMHKPLRFFAAANGTGGFRSYFDDIFPSDKMDGVFILKGGPGTGKSTLLREIAKAFDRSDTETEIFHCSSDPASLDGLLFTHEDHRVCVLDGTAPHERDARLPGACDTLTDLGACFDTARLRAERKNIISLQKEKRLAYKDAYFYLGLFGVFYSKIKAETENRILKKEIRAFVRSKILPWIFKKSNTCFAPRLIRAFSREGLVRLDTFERFSEKRILFHGNEAEISLVLSEILSILKDEGCGGYFAPSPFSDTDVDGIYLRSEGIAITTSDEAENTEDGARFFSPADCAEEERLLGYRAEAQRYLSLARAALARASEHHFALERIYTPAMNFEHLQPIKEVLMKQIADRLSLTEFS